MTSPSDQRQNIVGGICHGCGQERSLQSVGRDPAYPLMNRLLCLQCQEDAVPDHNHSDTFCDHVCDSCPTCSPISDPQERGGATETRASAFYAWFHGLSGKTPAGPDVGEAFRAGWNAHAAKVDSGDLFLGGEFVFHSGERSSWKIECDALSDVEIELLAGMISIRVGSFGLVEGVPRGGLRIAAALQRYADPMNPRAPLLIVDDVCTTGASLEQQRAGREAVGYVVFARGPVPSWCAALFTLDADRRHRQAESASRRGRGRCRG